MKNHHLSGSDAETGHRSSSGNNDLMGVGTWASGTQPTGNKHRAGSGSGTGPASKKDKMSASFFRWVENSQDDPWNHVTGRTVDKPAGGDRGKSSGA